MRIPHCFQCDILVPIQQGINQNTIIECDGDFFHCNPKKYPSNFMRFPNGTDKRTAQMIWDRDAIRVKELEEQDFKVIRLWESDINNMNFEEFKEILNKVNIKK
jgi:G:T-mismatch repair DNA endonuclease (very short patch repair protein)